MIKALKTWLLRRQVRQEVLEWAEIFDEIGPGYSIFGEEAFYTVKRALSARFPSAFIEIAEGMVTVVRNGITAKVAVA